MFSLKILKHDIFKQSTELNVIFSKNIYIYYYTYDTCVSNGEIHSKYISNIILCISIYCDIRRIYTAKKNNKRKYIENAPSAITNLCVSPYAKHRFYYEMNVCIELIQRNLTYSMDVSSISHVFEVNTSDFFGSMVNCLSNFIGLYLFLFLFVHLSIIRCTCVNRFFLFIFNWK